MSPVERMEDSGNPGQSSSFISREGCALHLGDLEGTLIYKVGCTPCFV